MSDTPLLTTIDAARHVGLSPKTLETMRIRGGGPKYLKIGRAVRYRPEALGEWLEGRTVATTTEASVRGVDARLIPKAEAKAEA